MPDTEQVDCEREKVEEGEKQERDKHEETTNARSNICHHGWHVDGTNAHHRHLEPRCGVNTCARCMRKTTCEVFLSTIRRERDMCQEQVC